MLKILCTGNPQDPGIAKELQKLYPNTTFISRSSGYDLLSNDGIDKFKQIVSEYDVFINHSQLIPDGQVKLLTLASEILKNARIINIGSVLEFDKWKWIDPESAKEKVKLRELSLSLNSESLKTTHIVVGGLKSTDDDHMRLDPMDVAKSIKWILESDIEVPLIYVENSSDELTKYWLSKKP